MDRLLLVYTLILCLPALAHSDLLIEGIKNIKKRSAQQTEGGIEVYSVNINSQVTSRFAHNVIKSRAVNRANQSQEVFFNVDLPKTAFITNFSMIIDGITYPGTIKEKEVAKKQYEKAVSQGQTAGLVQASGRKTEKFTVSVNVASQSKVTFELVYEEMLKRHLGKYEMFIKVKPKTLVKNFQIDVDIYEPQGISYLDAQGTFITNDLLPIIHKSISGKKGQISFNPTIDQQRSCANCTTTLLDGDFTVTYDVNRESPGNIQVVNGYFVHFFAPTKLPNVPKNVILVIDKSGSMIGTNEQQTKQAMHKILDDIKEHDHFNILLFSHEVTRWEEAMVRASVENVEKARIFVNTYQSTGLTNINDPLMEAIQILDRAQELKALPERSVSLIILLTDGEANTGEHIPAKIQENVKNANQGKYTLYSLGFGNNVDYPFLEKLAVENSGVARRIYEASDAALQLQGFYDEIANPKLINIQMQYPENLISDVTENTFRHYFDGSEIVVAGRITDNDLNSFTADVKAEGANDFLAYTENVDLQEEHDVLKQQYIFGDFTERLWAYLTIQQLLEKRIHASELEKTNLTEKALELSLMYKFVTPLTSMVVTKPEEKEKEEEVFIANKFVEGQQNVVPQQSYSYSAAILPYFPRPQTVYSVDSDPHFIIGVPEKNDALCFNIQEEPGVVLNLIKDPELGIAVNGELIGNKKTKIKTMESNETYFGKLGIVSRAMAMKIEVTTKAITLLSDEMKVTFSWLQSTSINTEKYTLIIKKDKSALLTIGEGATFVIILHQVWKDHPLHKDFLGFYTLDSHKFSEQTHGLLGQFFHGIDYEIFNIHNTTDPAKPDASMLVKNHLLTVTRGVQKDYRKDATVGSKVPCWFVHYDGQGLIDGSHTDYIVPNLFSFI